jgi:hypothetical protein
MPAHLNGKKIYQVMMHVGSMMMGNEMETEVGFEMDEIPFYGKQMVRGAGLDKLLKAVWMQKANEMM